MANEFMDMDEAAQFLHISKNTLYEYTSKRKIPYYKPTKVILFNKQELLNWMLQFRVKPMDEINQEATLLTLK